MYLRYMWCVAHVIVMWCSMQVAVPRQGGTGPNGSGASPAIYSIYIYITYRTRTLPSPTATSPVINPLSA